MQKEQLFIVVKIDQTKNLKEYGNAGKVFLYNRMLHPRERKYFVDVVTTRALVGVHAWDLNVGDAIACIPNGSIERDIPEHLKHLKKFKGLKKTTLNFWLPVRIYPSLKNLIIAGECNDKYSVAKDGSYLDTSYSSARALPDEEWECMPIAISADNQIVWFPTKRVSKVAASIKEDTDGKLRYCVQEISGDMVLSEVMVDPEVIHTRPEKGIERIEYLFPIDRYDGVKLDNGTELLKEQIPSLIGVLVIERKITKENEDAITKCSFMDRDPIAGYYSLMDKEGVDLREISHVEA
jgi:hypothetical protein